MALHLRKRGALWYARGVVRVGRDSLKVREFSTGCRTRADAEAAAAAEEARLRADHLDGAAGRARRLTIADMFAAYLGRPGGLQAYDVTRVATLNEAMGHRPLDEAEFAWRDWLRSHARDKPATAARWRTTLSAALNEGARVHRVLVPPLTGVKLTAPERVVYLTDAERKRLLAAYNPWAACPVLLLAYQGLRSQEALRLDWRRVHLERGVIDLGARETKTRRGRAVPMHPRVALLLWGLWHAAGQPDHGPVFLSQRGTPYADTRGRDGHVQGGNPLRQAHATACRRAGVRDFRVHDWRHDWAARMVMAGTDLYTLMRLGGWRSLRMVERYASVSGEHLAASIRKLA